MGGNIPDELVLTATHIRTTTMAQLQRELSSFNFVAGWALGNCLPELFPTAIIKNRAKFLKRHNNLQTTTENMRPNAFFHLQILSIKDIAVEWPRGLPENNSYFSLFSQKVIQSLIRFKYIDQRMSLLIVRVMNEL
jgi:hypothetical protein